MAPTSGIREIVDRAGRFPDAIHLELGEPDFPTPPHIVDTVSRRIRHGAVKYTATSGITELREEIAAKVAQRNGILARPDQVLLTQGGAHAVFVALALVLEPADEVLLPDPGWPSYRIMTHALAVTPKSYALVADDRFAPVAARVERLIGPRTRAIVLNSPANPTGTVASPAQVAELLELAMRHDLWVISDEAYDEVVFGASGVSPASISTGDRVLSAFTFSKTYAMTGWRVGYLVMSPMLAAAARNLVLGSISCVAYPSQVAGLAALRGPQEVVRAMITAYRRRRDAVMDLLHGGPLRALRPDGTFYVWVDHTTTGLDLDSRDFAASLLEAEHVAVVPGSAFGAAGEGFVRISLTTDQDRLLEGIRRMLGFVCTARGRRPNREDSA